MKRWTLFFLILVAIAALAAVYGTTVIRRGFRATDQPSAVETVMARTVRNLGIPRIARGEKNPWSATPNLLQEADMSNNFWSSNSITPPHQRNTCKAW